MHAVRLRCHIRICAVASHAGLANLDTGRLLAAPVKHGFTVHSWRFVCRTAEQYHSTSSTICILALASASRQAGSREFSRQDAIFPFFSHFDITQLRAVKATVPWLIHIRIHTISPDSKSSILIPASRFHTRHRNGRIPLGPGRSRRRLSRNRKPPSQQVRELCRLERG